MLLNPAPQLSHVTRLEVQGHMYLRRLAMDEDEEHMLQRFIYYAQLLLHQHGLLVQVHLAASRCAAGLS